MTQDNTKQISEWSRELILRANRSDIRKHYQALINIILDDDIDQFREYLLGLDEESRKLTFYCMGKDNNLIVHRLAANIIDNSWRYMDVMQELECDHTLDAPNGLGQFPVHIAANYGSHNILRHLAEMGCDLNQMETLNQKHTPATLVAESMKLEMLEILGELGADLSKPNGDGDTVAQFIRNKGTDDDARIYTAIVVAQGAHKMGIADGGAEKRAKRSPRAM